VEAISRPLDLRLTDAAEDDLAEIWATLATEASAQVATRFVSAIEATFEPLRHFPLSGPARERQSIPRASSGLGRQGAIGQCHPASASWPVTRADVHHGPADPRTHDP